MSRHAARRAPGRASASTPRQPGARLVRPGVGGGGEYAVYDAVRDEAVALGLALVRVEQRRHQLEDLFRAGGADERRRLSPRPARSTTSATATTTGRGWAGGRRSHRSSAPGCARSSASGAAAARRSSPGAPSSSGPAGVRGDRRPRPGRARSSSSQLRALPVGHRRPDADLRGRAGAGAGRQRHAPPGAAALLQPADRPPRLRRRQAGRPGAALLPSRCCRCSPVAGRVLAAEDVVAARR